MRKLIVIFVFTCFVLQLQAQNDSLKHFEISTSLILWTPTSSYLQNKNEVDNTTFAFPFTGYGTNIVPTINASYFFNKAFGVTIAYGYCKINNNNEKQNESRYYNYSRLKKFTSNTIRIGISSKLLNPNRFYLYYGVGVTLADYNMEMDYSNENFIAKGNDLGVYFKTGAGIRLLKFISITVGFDYSYIPSNIEYNWLGSHPNLESVKVYQKTNLGGIGLSLGLSFHI